MVGEPVVGDARTLVRPVWWCSEDFRLVFCLSAIYLFASRVQMSQFTFEDVADLLGYVRCHDCQRYVSVFQSHQVQADVPGQWIVVCDDCYDAYVSP